MVRCRRARIKEKEHGEAYFVKYNLVSFAEILRARRCIAAAGGL
jgi:hypothetical protein